MIPEESSDKGFSGIIQFPTINDDVITSYGLSLKMTRFFSSRCHACFDFLCAVFGWALYNCRDKQAVCLWGNFLKGK